MHPSAGLPGVPRVAVRLLHAGNGDGDHFAAGGEPDPTEEYIRLGLEGNLCRCTGYHNIVAAALAASQALEMRQ